jgi:pseudaminic acid cytidylyltransferase
MSGIVIIPARGGSKRIPRKNLLKIAGVPMLARPIQSGLATPGVDAVLVSTDDDEIAEVATGLGASVRGRRPSSLAADETPTAPVVAYEVDQFRLENAEPEFVIVMYPTSVFISEVDLGRMLKRLRRTENPVDMILTATPYPAPIERAWRVMDGDVGVAATASTRNRQSQEFKEHFYDVGQAYVSRADTWARIHDGAEVRTALDILPSWKAWDINTPDDLKIAETLLASISAP